MAKMVQNNDRGKRSFFKFVFCIGSYFLTPPPNLQSPEKREPCSVMDPWLPCHHGGVSSCVCVCVSLWRHRTWKEFFSVGIYERGRVTEQGSGTLGKDSTYWPHWVPPN